jgi:hypothetical protein
MQVKLTLSCYHKFERAVFKQLSDTQNACIAIVSIKNGRTTICAI